MKKTIKVTNTILLGIVSARIFQICQVINEVKKGIDFKQGFANVASSLGICESTVRDKISKRQLGLGTEKFIFLVNSYLENSDRTIIAILKGKVSQRNTAATNADLKYLEDFFA